MSRRPNIAVIKPNFGVNGGFERHLEDLIDGLGEQGWQISIVELDGSTRPKWLYGLPVEQVRPPFQNEYFMYMALVEQTQRLHLDHFDAVLTTQPPTYLVPHRRKVALFFHQSRLFYDLAGPIIEAGMVDPELHSTAASAIRLLERESVHEVSFWLAGSAESASRLDHYWSIPPHLIDIYRAPPTSVPASVMPYQPQGPIVSVSRLEWPKRPELLVQAMHTSKSGRAAHLVGGGSRLDFVKDLDVAFHRNRDLVTRSLDPGLWVKSGVTTQKKRRPSGPLSGRVVFEGVVSNERRDLLYDQAAVVVAPAYKEDYGLTAIEAMIRARPVIVCRDGGGLTELITDGLNGLIVEPNAVALAKAIDGLVADPARAERLGRAARKAVLDISMERAIAQVEEALLGVLDDERSARPARRTRRRAPLDRTGSKPGAKLPA